jgi:hypothetical protein
LSEIIYDIWVLPIRTTYKKRYSDSVALFLELLDKTGDFESVIRVCNNFFNHEFLDEKSNMYFLKAMVSLNRKQEAQKHYDRMVEIMYRELGVSPSYTFADILKQASESPLKSEMQSIDLEFINDILWKDERTLGAFQCDKDTFVAISKIMLRNLERSGLSIMMVLATFSDGKTAEAEKVDKNAIARNANVNTQEIIENEERNMTFVIEESRGRFVQAFRRGDIVCHWNLKQILIMLTNRTLEDAEIAMKRINKKKQDEILKERYDISYKIIPLEHEII